VLDAIEVRGLNRVSEPLVRSQIESRVNEPFDPRAVSRSIRNLYDLGFFTTIRAELERVDGRNVLIYTFEEEQFIQDLRIVGNDKIRERNIRGVLTWREGDAFVAEGYPEERDAILELYRSKGFLNTSVDIVVEPIAPSRVRLTYLIDEGKKARIKSVDYYGNDALSDRKLDDVVQTRGRILFIGGRYEQEKFEADLVNILNAYGDIGRLEAQIAATEFDYSSNGKKLTISIYLNEGPEYTVESIEFSGNEVFLDGELLDNIQLKEGEIHNRSQVDADGTALQDLYASHGYVNARVVPQVILDREAKTTRITHQIRENELKYVREVRVTGNSVTKDEVVRRQILLEPGERFDGDLLDISRRRLQSTGFFENTRIRLDDVPENDRFTNVLVDVEEGQTGNFNFGGAFNTDEGFGGFGELRLNNFDITNWPTFSGGGQVFNARFFLGTTRNNFSIGFTDPAFLGYPFTFGADIFRESFTGRGATDFTTEATGLRLRLGKRISRFNVVNASITVSDNELDDLDSFVSPSLRELEDPGSTLRLGLDFTRDTVNNRLDPRRGARHIFGTEIAGFGLDNEFVTFNHNSIFYYTPTRMSKFTFSFQTREDVGVTYGDREFLPLTDRFFAGGSGTVRGYDFRDISPRAETFRTANGQVFTEDEPIGGELRLIQNVEVKYRLTDLVRLYAFFDSGAVFLQPDDFDFGEFRFGTGVGVGFNLPLIGPLRVDYGFPLNPDSTQSDSGRIHLQSSLRF